MKKFSLQTKLREVLFLQEFGGTPGVWGALGVRGHIGIDINRGDMDPIPAYYAGTVVYVNEEDGTVAYLTSAAPDEEGNYLEVSHSHMRGLLVKVGDKVDAGSILGYQSTMGPSVAWGNELDRGAWSHEHINFRLAKMGRKSQNLRWDFARTSPIKYHVVEYDDTIDHFRDPNFYNQQVIEKFIQAIASHEGFTNKTSRPAIECNNPGNLRYSPLADGYKDYGTPEKPNKFAHFATVEIGWAALRRDVEIKATNRSAHMKATDSIAKFFNVYAPGTDRNDPGHYAQVVVDYCGLKSVENPISDVMLTELEYIRKYNNFTFGWYVKGESKGPILSWIFKAFRYLWGTSYQDKRSSGK